MWEVYHSWINGLDFHFDEPAITRAVSWPANLIKKEAHNWCTAVRLRRVRSSYHIFAKQTILYTEFSGFLDSGWDSGVMEKIWLLLLLLLLLLIFFSFFLLDVHRNKTKAWFSYAVSYATKLLLLPGILFRHMGTLRCRQQDLSQVFTAVMPAKLNSSQLRRHDGGKDWDDLSCWRLLFSYRKSTPGSTGDYVAGRSTAYENQA